VETDFYTTGGTCTGTICVASVAPATTDSTAIAPTGTLTSDTLTVVSAGPTPAPGSRYSVCPKGSPVRSFDVTAISAANLPGGTLTYNSRATSVKGTILGDETGPLQDPTAILYVRTSDLDTTTGNLKVGFPVEPLVLRAAAGDCINLTLRNHLPATIADLPGYNTLPMIVNNFNSNQVRPSRVVGLHPEMLSLNVLNSDGFNVG